MNSAFVTLAEMQKAKEDILVHLKETPTNELLLGLGEYIGEDLTQISKDRLSQEKIKLVVSGNDILSGRISVRLLSTIIGGFQDMTDYIGNAIANAPTNSGKIPFDIQKKTELQLISIFPGSFGVELMAELENNLMPEDALISQALNRMFALLSASDDADKVFEEIAELGTRTLKSYQEWIKNIQDAGVSLNIERKGLSDVSCSWQTDGSKLPKILDVLKNFSPTTEEITEMQGRLTELNVRTNRFEIVPDSGMLIRGKCSKEASEQCEKLMNKNVVCSLTKSTTKNLSTGKEKTTWFLSKAEAN